MNKYNKISYYFITNLHIVIPMCITALLFDGLTCFVPILEGKAIDSLLENDFNIVLKYCIIFFSLVLFVQLNRFFKRYLVRVFGNKMALKMRTICLDTLFTKDLNYFVTNNTGDILNRNLSDIYDTTEGIRKMTTEVFDTFVLLLGYFTMMFISDWSLTLIGLPFLVISVVFSHYMKKIVYKKNKEYKEYLSINKNITINKLNNELYYRGFGVSKIYYDDYYKSLKILKRKSIMALLFQGSLEPLYLCICLIGLGLIMYFGGMKVINNNSEVFTIGSLSAFVTTYTFVSKKVGKLGKLFNSYQAFKVSWVRCKDYLSIDNNINNCFIPLDDLLVVDNISHKYNEGFSISNISFNAKIGDIIGICGKVRCGKTTILRMLSGLYDYRGSAKLGGYEIKEYRNNPKKYIAYCKNEVSIFSDSVENNITFNREGDLDNALKVSKLDIDLDEIGGLNKVLSHTNSNISGGQQKRLQMARELYLNCRLILLDDPFQSVNRDLAIEMINELKNYKNSIIVLVSNNKDILTKCDNILFIDENNSQCDNYYNLINNNAFKELMEA